MDEELPEVLPGAQPSSRMTSRKRGSTSSDTDSDATEMCSESYDSSDDDFQVVLSKAAKRRLLQASSPASAATVKSAPQRWPHTVLFKPLDPTANLRLLNRQVLSLLLEKIAPDEIKDVRINSRKNVLAVDVLHRSAIKGLRSITEIDNIKVQSVIPLGGDSAAGVIYDVDVAISNDDLPILIKPISEGTFITKVTRLGSSRCVKVVFEGDSLPSHVKVGHVRHPVRPFVPKPLQCFKCCKIGHVKGVCVNNTVCPRCSESHSEDACSADVFKCPNCSGTHKASSKDCPKMRKEAAILKQMVRDNSTHREAAATLRRRRRRHRKRSQKTAEVDSDATSLVKKVARSTHSTAKKDTETTSKVDRVARPDRLSQPPRVQRATEVPQSSPTSKTSATNEEALTNDAQVINILRSLMSAIRIILSNMKSSSAQSALQVLDTLSPVLAALR